MSSQDFAKAVQLLESNKTLYQAIMPQGLDNIKIAEDILHIKLPKDYKKFINLYGSLSIGSQDVFGLTNDNDFSKFVYENIVCNTMDLRKNEHIEDFPANFIPIHALGDGEISCLDTSQMNSEGKCPVVAWYFGRVEKVAEDFGAFLLEKVICGFESLERDGVQVNWLGIKKDQND